MPETVEQSIGEVLAMFEGNSAPAQPEEPAQPQAPEPVQEETPVEEAPVIEPEQPYTSMDDFIDEGESVEETPQEPVEQAQEQEQEQESDTPDLLEMLRQQNELIIAQGEQLAQLQMRGAGTAESPRGPEVVTEPPSVQPQTPLPQLPALTQEQYDNIMSSPEAFQGYLQEVQRQAQAATAESIMQQLGPIVNKTVSHHVSVSAMVSNFYKDNPDLMPYRNQIGILANEILAANPGMPYAQLFKQVGEQAREKLRPLLNAQKNRQVQRPGFAGRKPTIRNRQGEQKSAFDQEIDEMLALPL